MVDHYALLAAGTVPELNYLPWLLPVVAIAVAGRRSATRASTEEDVSLVKVP